MNTCINVISFAGMSLETSVFKTKKKSLKTFKIALLPNLFKIRLFGRFTCFSLIYCLALNNKYWHFQVHSISHRKPVFYPTRKHIPRIKIQIFKTVFKNKNKTGKRQILISDKRDRKVKQWLDLGPMQVLNSFWNINGSISPVFSVSPIPLWIFYNQLGISQ